MRIVVGANNLGFGGAEAAIVTVTNELARRDHDMTVWILRPDEPAPRLGEFEPTVTIRRLELGSFKSPSAVRHLRSAVRADRPEAALYIANPVAAAAHRAVHPTGPVSYWVQNYIRPRRIRWLEAGAQLAGVGLVGLNDSVAETVPGGCRAVIANPMPPPPTTGARATSPAWFDGQLLIVGRIVPQKDHAFLIDVMAALRAMDEPCSVDVIGDGGLLDALRTRCAQRGVADVVRFHGRTSAGPWFARGPLVVMTSHWEGHSLVLMEAANHGCPIVARDAPGVRDVLGADYEGLTAHDNPEAMATTIADWVRNRDATTARAAQLQRRLRAAYSRGRVADAWERLFRDR